VVTNRDKINNLNKISISQEETRTISLEQEIKITDKRININNEIRGIREIREIKEITKIKENKEINEALIRRSSL
jgi:hypothetical protein